MNNQQSDVYAKVVAVIKDQLSLAPEAIKPDSTLESLGADSLDRVEITMRLEEQLGVEIDDARIEKLHTIQELVGYIATLHKS